MQKQTNGSTNGNKDFTPAERAVIDAVEKDLNLPEPHGAPQRAEARAFADAVLTEQKNGTELHAAIMLVFLGSQISGLVGDSDETETDSDLG